MGRIGQEDKHMFFRNKNNSQPRRSRKPEVGGTAATPVFSYHASSARTDKSSSRKTASGLLWATNKPPGPRPRPQQHRSRKGAVVALLLIAAVLFISNLILSRDPEVIALAGTDGRRLFLRSQDSYYQAARQILNSSPANTNKLTINSGRIAKEMQERFPELEVVSVTLPIVGRKPSIYIQPARPALLLRVSDGGLYIVDTVGRALISASQVSKADKLGLPLVDDQSGLLPELGKNVLPSDSIAFITEVVGQLKAKNIKVTSVSLPKATNELDIRVEGKPYAVKFNLRGDARAEVGAFLAVKQHLERENKTPSSYIDVRVDNKAYYK